MKKIILFYSFLILSLSLCAQSKTQPSDSNIKKQPAPIIKINNGKNRIASPIPVRRRSLIQAADTLTMSDYMMSLERVNDNLNNIWDNTQLGFEAERLGKEIKEIEWNIKLIRQNIRNKHSSINIKSIYLYQSFATNLDDNNNSVRTRLDMLYYKMYHAKLRLKTILHDPVLRDIYAKKTVAAILDKKLDHLERKWAKTDSTVKINIDTLNILKVNAAENSMTLSNMLNMMDRRLNKAKPQLFKQEVNCLWQIPRNGIFACDSTKTVNLLANEYNAMGYYINQTANEKGFILFLGFLLIIWMFFKRKLLKNVRKENTAYNFLHLHFLNYHPVLPLLVILFSLMPFFDAYAPTSYIAIEYSLLLLVVSLIFLKKAERTFLPFWFAFVALFIADVATYLLSIPTFITRLWMLAIHITIIAFSCRFYTKITRQMPYYKWIKPATFIGIILTGLAVLCNFLGRFSLAGLLGLSGIFAITQILILPVFIETIIEIVLLQLLSSRLKKGINGSFDCSIVTNKIKPPLVFISLILWLIMFSSNLNIYHDISTAVVGSLTSIRTVGKISFKLISIFLFFIIIWIAHILQRLISFLFGETGNEFEDLTTVSKGQHSRLLITRLLVLIGGYLLAIMASGLPIDKLTIVLGALSVGIGMGLQSVVNNFVSGIILIFDGSLQIGDEIEVSGQSGKVKEIGLRASTINTADGAEVIIPNGTILSQNIINWTFSNDQKRVTLTFSLSGKELDTNIINNTINATIKGMSNLISKRNPVILYTNASPDNLSLMVHFWSTIGNTEQAKSSAMLSLSAAFTSQNIGFNKSKFNCTIIEDNSKS